MEKFSTALTLRFILLSSPKDTSKTQCNEFSIPQCFLIPFDIFRASGFILRFYKRSSLSSFPVLFMILSDSIFTIDFIPAQREMFSICEKSV